jgi:hypothetical protein
MSRGLTLVELVVTIGLLGIIGIPTGLLVGEQLIGSVRAKDSTVAMQLGRAHLERLDSLDDFFHPELSVGARTVTPSGFPAYAVTTSVTCASGNCTSGSLTSQGIKRIQVTVTKSGSPDPLARLITSRTKHVAFGS